MQKWQRHKKKKQKETLKMHLFKNSSADKAKIENVHYTVCLQLISSSGQIALPPAFARLEQRGVVYCSCNPLVLMLQKQRMALRVSIPQFKLCWRTTSTYLSSNRSGILSSCLLFSFSPETPFRRLLEFSLIHSLNLTPSSLQNYT